MEHALQPNRTTHHLNGLSGEAGGRIIHVEGELIMGRSTTCDVFLPDRRMSRRHARFFLEGRRLFVEDLESHNGTYVNGKRVARVELLGGDVVRIGSSQLEVEIHDREDSERIELTRDKITPHLIKPLQNQARPSLDQMLADEYFEAIGAGESDIHRATDPKYVEFLFRQTRNFATLHEISRALQSGNEPIGVMRRVLDVILKVAKADRGFIAVLDEQGLPVPLVVRGRHREPESEDLERVRMSSTVADQVLRDKCGVITSDAATDVRFAGAESVVLNDIHSLMAVPIMVGDDVKGLIEVENHSLLVSFCENDLDLMAVVASMVGVTLDNLHLVEQQERTIAALETAQEQLLAAQEKLVNSERMAIIGRLGSGIAHEVRNHLSPFMLADLIAKSYPDDEDIQEAAELMLEAQRRILGLVDEIRHFAAGSRAEFKVEPHDLVRVIEGVIRFVRCDARVKAAELVVTARSRPLVEMDANRMRQVIINLIRNAADAVDPETGRIEVIIDEFGDEVIIEVRDNGVGIPADVADKLFEPFYTTKGEEGLGLGLDISRNIVKAHGGELSFTTRVGHGTTFHVKIPAEQPIA